MFVDLDKIIQVSIRQAERWYRASLQDKDLKIANLHIDYAVNGIDTLRMFVNDKQITDITGIDPLKFRNQAIERQDEVQSKILKVCTNL